MEKFNFNIKSVIDCLAPSEVTMITGGHCVGKTMLALNIAAQYGINENKTVAIFSLEWSDCQGVQRILHMLANVEMRDVKESPLAPKELELLGYADEELKKSKIFIDDCVYITLPEIEVEIEDFVKTNGSIDLIIIDYLELLLHLPTDKMEIVKTVDKFKLLAKKFNAPLLLLSQRREESKNILPPSIADNFIHLIRTSNNYTLQQQEFYMTFDYGKHKGDKILLDCDFRRGRISEKI